MASTPGFEPGSHWWEVRALTTVPLLLPNNKWFIFIVCMFDWKLQCHHPFVQSYMHSITDQMCTPLLICRIPPLTWPWFLEKAAMLYACTESRKNDKKLSTRIGNLLELNWGTFWEWKKNKRRYLNFHCMRKLKLGYTVYFDSFALASAHFLWLWYRTQNLE